jgi:hypothetical protein
MKSLQLRTILRIGPQGADNRRRQGGFVIRTAAVF